MKWRLHVKAGNNDWWEDYDHEEVSTKKLAEQKGRNFIDYFNDTLKPGERRREFLEAEVVGSGTLTHKWEKRTDGMSRAFRGSTVDMMYCSRCGITGKRFGLSPVVTRDSKFKAKKYELCREAPHD